MSVLDRDPEGGPESRLWAAGAGRVQEHEQPGHRRKALYSDFFCLLLLVRDAAQVLIPSEWLERRSEE
jgi:hypothetical protein